MYKTLFILSLLFSTAFSKSIITVTHPVQEYFIKKIAGNEFYIRSVFSKSHDFEFSNKRLINKLSSSKYYFVLNLPEEEEILKLFKKKNKKLKVIDITKGIGNLKLENGKMNPFVWMDPLLARDFAKRIYEQLVKIQFYNRAFFKENYELFLDELDTIYLELKKRIDNSNLYGFFAFNNQLDYFAKRYRLDIYHRENRRLHINEVSKVIRFVKREHIKHIIIAKDSDYTIAQSFSGHINGKIVEIDIYDRNWKINMFSLIRGITNF